MVVCLFPFYGRAQEVSIGGGVEGGPIGAGIFSKFPLDLGVSVRQGYDDNVFTSEVDPIGSPFTNIEGVLSYDFGSPRLRLSLNLVTGVTYYPDRPGRKYDYNLSVLLNGFYRVTDRFFVEGTTNISYLPQPNYSIQAALERDAGNYFYSTSQFRATYLMTPRWSLQGSYEFTVIQYEEESFNDRYGRYEQEFGLSLRYMLTPTVLTYLQYRYNPITYFEAELNNAGHYLVLGSEVTFNPRLRWLAQVGAEYRTLENPISGPGDYFGPYFQSTLRWNFAPKSFVSWYIRYGSEPSGQTNVTIRETLRTNFRITHAFTARIQASAYIGYALSHYDQPGVIPDYDSDYFNAGVELKFNITRNLYLIATYSRSQVNSEISSQDYTRNRYSIGGGMEF